MWRELRRNTCPGLLPDPAEVRRQFGPTYSRRSQALALSAGCLGLSPVDKGLDSLATPSSIGIPGLSVQRSGLQFRGAMTPIRMREGTPKRPRPAAALPSLSQCSSWRPDRPSPCQLRTSREDGMNHPATLQLDRGALGARERTRLYAPIRTDLSTSPGGPANSDGQLAVSSPRRGA